MKMNIIMPSQYRLIMIFRFISDDPPNSCFINNHFEEGLLAWEANLDIQPVINHYKAVTYMSSYFSKSEDETSRGGYRVGRVSRVSRAD